MATFYNQATLTYNGNVTNSNITTGEIREAPSATKDAVIGTYGANDNITYVINIVNTGSSDYTNFTIEDNLGSYSFGTETRVPLDYVENSVQYYVNGVRQTAPAVTAGPPLEISGINVPAGSNATVIYVARANRFAPLAEDGTITNTAVISGTGITDITVSETVTAENEAALTINKSLSPETVTENSTVTYTFVIQNSGNTAITAADTVTVTDTFDPILSDITVTFNGSEWTETANYTYDEATGLFTTALGQVTVPAATYTQDLATGAWIINPGVSTLVITGTI